jgi:alcohol dehydrogenase class IV
MIRMYFNTQVRFGYGAIELLPKELKALGIARPLLVTDPGLVASGIAAEVHALLPAASPLFSELPANPDAAHVAAATTMYRDGDCDGIVALGGGSALDLAKGVAVMATHEGELREYDVMKVIRKQGRPIGPQTAPVVAIPTTAGTGSEVANSALIIVGPGEKILLSNNHILPRLAIADPALTLTLPRALTAGTGMDALSHCIESLWCVNENPPVKAVAVDGAARLYAHIRTAVAEPGNREARSQMLMGAIEGGMTMANGLGAVHALSHALGGLPAPKLHHGTVNAVLLPAVMEFNRPHCAAHYPRLHAAFALAPGADLVDAIRALNAELGMPRGLAAMGLAEAQVPAVAAAALRDINALTNPVRPTQEQFEQMLRDSM